MKKFFLIVVCLAVLLISTSCNGGFDRTKTDNLYAQIILNDNRKINLKLYYDKAPITVDNFIDLVEDGYYNNTIFHRVIKNFMIQGGGYVMSSGKVSAKKEVESIKGEFAENGWKKNNIKHITGVISMARASSFNSGSSQFFICSTVRSDLDGKYAAFGKTTDSESRQVVVNISEVKTYAYSNAFTDMPVNVIKIKNIKLSNTKFTR